MRSTISLLILAAASTVLRSAPQSPFAQTALPPILGNFAAGTYSNSILGFRLQLPADWRLVNFGESESFSRGHPRRLNLHFKSNDDWLLLSASPLDPDEKLEQVFAISLQGASDGGGFHSVGKKTAETTDGHEVLSQKLARKLKIGSEGAIYRGFSSHGYYVSLLHLGPASSQEAREKIAKTLHFLPDDPR